MTYLGSVRVRHRYPCGFRHTSSRFIANQFRLLLAALAYTLMHRLRALAPQAAELERANAATIGVRLLKIGAAMSLRLLRFAI